MYSIPGFFNPQVGNRYWSVRKQAAGMWAGSHRTYDACASLPWSSSVPPHNSASWRLKQQAEDAGMPSEGGGQAALALLPQPSGTTAKPDLCAQNPGSLPAAGELIWAGKEVVLCSSSTKPCNRGNLKSHFRYTRYFLPLSNYATGPPPPPPVVVHGKNIFYATGPWSQIGWGSLMYITVIVIWE